MRLHVNFSVCLPPSSGEKIQLFPKNAPAVFPLWALVDQGWLRGPKMMFVHVKSCRHQKYPLVISGKFVFKPYKTSEPETKLVHHLGMIAGGTGKRLLGASSTG